MYRCIFEKILFDYRIKKVTFRWHSYIALIVLNAIDHCDIAWIPTDFQEWNSWVFHGATDDFTDEMVASQIWQNTIVNTEVTIFTLPVQFVLVFLWPVPSAQMRPPHRRQFWASQVTGVRVANQLPEEVKDTRP